MPCHWDLLLKIVTKFQNPTNLCLVNCLMKVIVVISCCCPRDCLSLHNVLCIVPFTAVHIIAEVILSFNLRTKFPQCPVRQNLEI